MCQENELGRALTMVVPVVMVKNIFTNSLSEVTIKNYLYLGLQERLLWEKIPVRLALFSWVSLPQTSCVIIRSSFLPLTVLQENGVSLFHLPQQCSLALVKNSEVQPASLESKDCLLQRDTVIHTSGHWFSGGDQD